MRAWSFKSLDVLEDVVHASLHVGERLIDRLVARDRGGGFLADDGFDRELAADLFRERRRGVGDLGERGTVRQRAPFGAVDDRGERGPVAGACPIRIFRGAEFEDAERGVVLGGGAYGIVRPHPILAVGDGDRQRVVTGTSVYARVDLSGRLTLKQ